MATNPGDGMNNPFGNGAGGAGPSGPAPSNFMTNPGGSHPGGPSPRNFAAEAPPAQKPSDGMGRNADSVPQGGPLPFVQPAPDAGNPIGVGSIGTGGKSFRLGGG